MGMNVAIDGPAGAGKSSISKIAAQKLGYIYVDTGAMYRAITLYMLENNIDIADEVKVAQACENVDVSLGYENGQQIVYLNGRNVNGFIRTEEVSRSTSKVSAQAAVRAKLLELQRTIAREHDILMDGRDIGTNVLPDAQCKIYLTASEEERAKRRFLENQKKGIPGTFEEVLADIKERDYRDMHREIAPLKQAEDAILVDTSDMSMDQVTARICELVAQAAE